MASFDALIFDVDGTLADTERDGHRVAFNRAFADAGLDWDWTVELYGQLLSVTGGKERIMHYLDRYNRAFARPADLEGFVAELHRSKTRHYMALMADGAIPLRPGVERLLREARGAGMRLAIATTTTPENVSALIESTLSAAALEWFEVIGAGDIVAHKKPAPDIYQWVLAAMQMAPQRAIAFEDSAHGVSSARDAGIDRVLVTVNDYTVGQPFVAASVVLDSLGEADAPAHGLIGPAPHQGVVDLDYLATLQAAPAAPGAITG